MTLVDLLPGLSTFPEEEVGARLNVAGLPRDWWRTLPPADFAQVVDEPGFWIRVAELVVDYGSAYPLTRLAPLLADANSVPHTARWPRAVVIALRRERLDWRGLVAMSPGELLARPRLRRTDVVGIVAGALREAHDRGAPVAWTADPVNHGAPKSEPSPDPARTPPTPEPASTESRFDIVACVTAFTDTWTQRETRVAVDRLFAHPPATLEAIAQDIGITREGVRQIQKKCRARLEDWAFGGGNPQLASYVAKLAARLGPIARVRDLIEADERHRTPIDSLRGIPLWRVPAALLPHRMTDEWLTHDTLADAEDATRRALREICADGAVPWSEVENATRRCGVYEDALADWLDRLPQIRRFDTQGVWWGSSINDKAEAVLTLRNVPLTAEQIIELVNGDYAFSSVCNQLQADERFMRTDRLHYGLRRWDLEEYLGIREMIERELRTRGGAARIDAVVESLTSRFDISENSVRAYATGPSFDRYQPGWIRLPRTDASTSAPAYKPRRDVSTTQRCFRDREQRWWHRIDLNGDHLRGSGFPVPTGFAAHLGLVPGARRTLTHDAGEVTVVWRNQPCFGSMRPLLLDLNAAEGDHLFVIPSGDRLLTRHIRPVEDDLPPLQRAVRLVGWTTRVPDAQALPIIASRIGLPATTPLAAVLARLGERRDKDLIDLLTPS
ncbi:sigma factor-like helix-turn-helix DNA-binding protein [Embleya sp. NPDC050493]|uniref:sigma factor-like helix-turn-helix DNA-binding protein n=1 Tax=Embleya sp. NPDC050493 TaxID=3363989 RepID=UPI00378D20D0